MTHTDDPLLSFGEAGRSLRPDRPVHPSTFHRWMKGVRGRRLETTLVGGRRYVRRSQLEAFIAALSGSEPSKPVPAVAKPATPSRRRQIAAARAELEAAGIV